MPSKPDSINISNRILRSFFGSHMPLIESSIGLWTLNSEYSVGETIDDKGNIYTLWHFPISEELVDISKNFPFFFSYKIKCGQRNNIEDVSIKIFKENTLLPKDTALIPTELLLRVEWSNLKEEEVNHAQPHWHVHSYKYDNFLDKASPQCKDFIKEALREENDSFINSYLEEKSENIERSNFVKEIPPYKFHLAMLADWHLKNSSSNNKELTQDILKIWLPKCLEYIKEQIEYILKRI